MTGLTRPQRHRVLQRAVALWRAGKPHSAWETLNAAGLSRYWPAFQRAAFKHARARYTRTMSRYVA